MESDFNKRIRKVMINIGLIGAVSIITYLLYSTIEKNKIISEKDKRIILDSMTIVAKVKELKGIKAAYEILEKERDAFGLANDSLVAVVATINEYISDMQIKDSLQTLKIDQLNSMIGNAKKTLVKEKEEFNLIEKVNQVDVVKVTNVKRHVKIYQESSDNINVKVDNLEIEPVNKSGSVLTKNQFSHSHIKHIRIKFIIEKSGLTSKVQKIFSVQLMEPDGSLYKFDPDYDFIKIDGYKVHLTNRKKIEFDGNDTQVSFLYPKSTPFKPGMNIVKLFCENQLVAEKTIDIK
jgi:hypothetical protein